MARLGLARSSYFSHRARMKQGDKYLPIRQAMKEAFESNHRCYGCRRLKAYMKRESILSSEKVVRRLMKQEALNVPSPERRHYSAHLGECSTAPENIINREFHAEAPNEKWLTDITDFHIRADKVYLFPIIDCFDGLVISWTTGTRPNADLVNTMLDAAVESIADSNVQPIARSNRGGHYRWPGWLERIDTAKLVRSMSRTASSQDNATCESFFGRLKTEFFYPRDWRAFTVAQFIDKVYTYIRWCDEARIKMSLGGKSPNEYSKRLGIMP